MNVIRKKHLSRRTLLRGAGSAVALPLLESMFPAATAFAQSAAAPRTRLACIYIPHGAVMDRWTPVTEGTDFEFPQILKPIEPFRDRVNVVSDFSLPLAYGSDASAGANHTRSSAVWLAGAAPASGGHARLGITVDQAAANHIGQDTPLPSLELCIEDGGLSCGTGLSCAYRNTISWQGDESPLPMENNPQVVFERLFGDGATAEERAARRAQARSMLDALTGEVATLRRGLPPTDRERLERYLDDVREVERRIRLAGEMVPEDLDLPPAPTGIPDSFDAHVKLMFDLLTLAWQTDITRVSTMLLAKEVSNAVYRESGITDPFHNLSHHSNIPDNIERLAQLNTYHTSIFAYFLDKLATTPDGDGNLLDHSLVLYGSGMSNSNQHDHDPLPIILAGGASGRLAGGRHLRSPVPKATLSNLLLAMLDKLDVPQTSFGDSTDIMTI
ncbi:MAG: DUF1552 domain-containing protein [Gammaproteobacteria bacterium]|nr:DUF1552 domain-containing protein [Gammaproteobacteria bacterium]